MLVQKVSTTVSAMVGWNFKFKLAILPRNIDGNDYVKHFLKPVVEPFFRKERAKAKREKRICQWIFQEDNESAHGTKSVLNASNDFKNKYNIKQLKPVHSPDSPDLSPIENV
ncbi:hypothetical protein BDZ45DRAFT_737176 [Acephala macrosclerotiorum]|nr:hypothetical protein BDZ45DRAFT_737176 [Acephala macrosclerotiorum]